MSWAEVKGALNGAFNGDRGKTLDRIISQKCYDVYYDSTVNLIKAGVISSSEYSFIEKGKKVLNSNYEGVLTARYLLIPRSITSVSSYAFYDVQHSLEELVLPDSVTDVGEHAFGYGNTLKKVFLPKSIKTIADSSFNESQITDIFCGFNEGEVSGAPWGATNAQIHYGCDYCW